MLFLAFFVHEEAGASAIQSLPMRVMLQCVRCMHAR